MNRQKTGPQLLYGLIFMLLAATPVAAQAGYTSTAVVGGGAITGTVKWLGAQPKALKLPISKNPDVCDPESRKIRDLERLQISSDGGVANTVVYLKDIHQGKPMDLLLARQHLDQKNCRYIPHILLVPEAGALRIRSSDPILHTVHMSGAAANNVPFPFQNIEVPVSMHRDGLVDLKCNAGHVWMNAEVLVVGHPYYAVTDEHGAFRLTDVPAGEYEIEAWHEGWGIVREETVLDIASQTQVRRPIYSEPKTWSKKITVQAGATAVADFSISKQ